MDPSNTICITTNKKVSVHNYKWVLNDFCCKFANTCGKNIPSVKLEFDSCNNMHFIGSLSLEGVSCSSRKLVFELNCTTHTFWTVTCDIRMNKNVSGWSVCLDSNIKRRELRLLEEGSSTCSLEKTSPTTILCQIEVEAYESTSNAMFPIKESKPEKSKFWQIFETKKYSDVSFQVGDEKIDAHKNILACTSPVFEAMFEHPMAESLTNIVIIEDVEARVFKEMLRFIYCDEVHNLKTYAAKLLQASDKYNLQILKNKCEKELADNIAIENAAEIFILADLHCAKDLKEVATKFIIKNRKAVAETQNFQDIVKTHPHLLAKLLMEIIN